MDGLSAIVSHNVCTRNQIWLLGTALVHSVSLPADTRLYTLKNLSPGDYNICVQAVTDAGAGAGSNRYMHIGEKLGHTQNHCGLTRQPCIFKLNLCVCVCVCVKPLRTSRCWCSPSRLSCWLHWHWCWSPAWRRVRCKISVTLAAQRPSFYCHTWKHT